MMQYLWNLLMLAVILLAPVSGWATTGCYKITLGSSNPVSSYYTEPGTIVAPWSGALDTAGRGAFRMVAQITPQLVPDGTLLASAEALPQDLGAQGVGGYQSEQVLYRCSPDSAGSIYEFYSTNGDNQASGHGSFEASGPSGIPNSYASKYRGLIFRVTNLTTGQPVTHRWKAREMTAELDRDSQGWYLVKVKNFSLYRMELFQCIRCNFWSLAQDVSGTKVYDYTQPFAYAAFRGGRSGAIPSPGLREGDEHRLNVSGWYGNWPLAINPLGGVVVKQAATCAVVNTTPVVDFGAMNLEQLEQGASKQAQISIRMMCTGGVVSGVAQNQTALGILAPAFNANIAKALGLTMGGDAVSYLLSDGYGQSSGVAQGVGVALSRPSGSALGFLSSEQMVGGGERDGWYPALDDAQLITSVGGGLTLYERNMRVAFKAFAPGRGLVKAGRYQATAQVVVRVQ
jgi:type 1 fimbria pilin